jgi:hypothetical protein
VKEAIIDDLIDKSDRDISDEAENNICHCQQRDELLSEPHGAVVSFKNDAGER